MRLTPTGWTRVQPLALAALVVAAFAAMPATVAGAGAPLASAQAGTPAAPQKPAEKPPEKAGGKTGGKTGGTKAGAPSKGVPKPKPTPLPPPAIEGLVKDPAGKPVEGARAYVRPSTHGWSEDPTAPRSTDANGRFRFDLKTRAPHDLRIEAKGFGAWRKERVAPGARVDVVLDKGRAIEGLVRDENGQPAPGVRVEAVSRGGLGGYWDAESGVRRTETDARGRFRLEGLDPSLQMVSAWSGNARAQRHSVRTGTSLTLTLRPQAVIAGIVTGPDGQPVAGALVRHAKEPHYWHQGFLTSAAPDGRFEIVGVEAGPYSLVARHPDYALVFVTGVNVEARGQVEVHLTLHPGTPVEGRLADAEGKPIVGRARLGPAEGAAPPGLGELFKAEADADGRFRIPRVGPGGYALTATADGFATQRVELTVGDRMPVADLGDVVLERGLNIRGQVRTAAGLPIAEANVSCTQNRQMFFSWPTETRSLADGSFILGGLVPGNCDLQATAPGYTRGRASAEVGAENVAIVLEPGGSLTGRVVEEGDRPVEAYQARLEAADRGQSARYEESRIEAVGSADGRFTFEDLKQGRYVLQIVVPERTPLAVPDLAIATGRTTDAGTIRVGRGGLVKGTVASTSGGAILGATVRLRTPGQDMVQWTDAFVAQSESDGGFEIRGVPTGKASVQASHPDYAAAGQPVDVDPAKGPTEVRLVLSQGARIEGTARRRDGSPLGGLGVHVWPQQQDGMMSEIPPLVTAADGSFAVDHVPPGPVKVVLMANAGSGAFTNMADADAQVREGETTTVSLVVQDIVLSGRALRGGNPLVGALIEVFSESGVSMVVGGGALDRTNSPATGPERNRATTREDGSYEMIVGGPGKYHGSVRLGRQGFPGRSFEVPDVDAHVVDYSYPGTTVSGIVVDKEAGQPLARGSVSANWKDKGGGWVSSATGPDGRFELDIEPGRRTIVASAEGYARTVTETDVPPDGMSDLKFELEKGLTLKGRLLDPNGQRLSGFGVNIHSGGKPPIQNGTQTLPDGSFAFEGLKEGRYALCAGGPLVGYAVRTGVAAGSSDVTLTVRPGGKLQVHILGPDGTPRPRSYPWVKRIGGVEVTVPTMGGQPTDAEGRTTIDVPAGTLEVTARDEKWQGTASVSVGEGGTASVEIRMDQPADSSH